MAAAHAQLRANYSIGHLIALTRRCVSVATGHAAPARALHPLPPSRCSGCARAKFKFLQQILLPRYINLLAGCGYELSARFSKSNLARRAYSGHFA